MAKRRSSWGRQKYKNLKQSIVIFVCAFDLFGDNRSIYTFETICRENTDITLQDKRKTYFINIYGDRSGIEKDTVNLLDYFKTGEPTDDYTKKLQEKVEEIRCDDEWRENYMTIEMKMDQRFEDGKQVGMQAGKQVGMQVGRHEERIKVVKTMLANSYSEAECKKLGFTQEEIQEGKK